MIVRPISRRALLRGAGVCMALPFLEVMTPSRAKATAAPVQRFIAFFYPNGTDPPKWNPAAGALVGTSLPECLQDMNGFAAEGIWPAESAIWEDVTVVTGIDHQGVCAEIHNPSMALSAHKGPNPPQPTLDQVLAEKLRGSTPYRNFALSATTSNDISQGNISFKAGAQPETNVRNPRQLFDTLFGSGMVGGGDMAAAERARLRQQSVLDVVREDATRLNMRLGAQDKQRIDQYFTAISEVERQINTMPPSSCTVPMQPASGGNWHAKAKAFVDLTVLAMACDLTRVVTIQYSDSWGVNYPDYTLGTGVESLGTWSDHFISHKLDDTDRATDLDGLDRTEAMRIANVRVVQTSRFKVRRFAYLVNRLKGIATATGTLLDEALVMYCSENGDGDSHARKNMPILLAGHAGGFQTGRAVAATNKVTGSLHASIQNRFGMDVSTYGDPAGPPIAEL
ncbi:MAG TPA: DUF1552 domain-containing protein [Polyangiaceae bacterium]